MQYSNGSYMAEPSNSRVVVDPTSPECISAASGAKTATGNSNAYASENVNAAVVTVIVSAVSGTTPSMTVSLQDAATFGGAYTSEGSSVAITAVGTYQFIVPVKNAFWRILWTITGTTPSFTTDFKVTPFVYGVSV